MSVALERIKRALKIEAPKRGYKAVTFDDGHMNVYGNYEGLIYVWVWKGLACTHTEDFMRSIDFSDRWDGEGDPSEVARRWINAFFREGAKSGIQVDCAVDVVARGLLSSLPREFQRENYPEIGEHDWDEVVECANEILEGMAPSADAFLTALGLLASRTSPSTETE